MGQKTIVILIHGIRTEAWWQSRVASVLKTGADITPIPLKYGYFDLIRFWCPFGICRSGPISRLHGELERICEENKDARIVVFAHSFGTYALSQILFDDPDIKFNRVVLSGSIIPENFKWKRVETQILCENKREAIINDCGTRDIWPVLARSASWGYGATGTYGFGSSYVTDRFHPVTHSDFFETKFVREFWVPAVADGSPVMPEVGDSSAADQGTPAWFEYLRAAPINWLLGTVISGAAAFLMWSFTRPPCNYCPEMVVAPPGLFRMGETEADPGHDERISYVFAVGKYPVTFAEWDACVAHDGCDGYIPPDNGWGRGSRPVINVSWYDAKNYVAWLSKETGDEYRLPTDIEREFFTRAGTTTKYWWGNAINFHQANYSSKQYARVDAPDRSMPVEAFAPNPWGLYQVHGNIWEWVEDCRVMEGKTCKMRVLRGGGWDMDADILQSSNGGQNSPDIRGGTVGFRVVKTLRRR